MRTIILPCAGPLAKDNHRPPWLLTAPNGDLVVFRAAASVVGYETSRVVVGISEEADIRFGAFEAIRRNFEAHDLPAPDIVIIKHQTSGPAETVFNMIGLAGVDGPIAIKDSDSFFDPAPIPGGSFIATCDLRENLDVTRVGEKSFVHCNEQGMVSDVIEKVVSSNLVSAGLYGFSDIQVFRSGYAASQRALMSTAFFVSHVVSSVVTRGEVVTAVPIGGFVEVDSSLSWNAYRNRQITLVLDIDGVVFENHSRYFSPNWDDDEKPIEANIARLRELQKEGAQLIFVTSRSDQYREKTLRALQAHGLRAHALIMGCLHGRRYLVNDFAASNPYPTAVAINLVRNSPDLAKILA